MLTQMHTILIKYVKERIITNQTIVTVDKKRRDLLDMVVVSVQTKVELEVCNKCMLKSKKTKDTLLHISKI